MQLAYIVCDADFLSRTDITSLPV